MNGPEHDTIKKAKRVALVHNAIQEARVLGNDYTPFLPRLEKAMDELVQSVMDLEIYETEQNASKN